MKKNREQQIKQAFFMPPPAGRQEFFLSLCTDNTRRTGLRSFLYLQAGYIRKRVWIASVLLFAAVLSALWLTEVPFRAAALCSALLPLLSLFTMSELSRSLFYNMAELEMSCKYSLSRIVLARMGLLGILQLVCFLGLFLLLAGRTGFSIWQLGLYLLLPMLAETFLTMFLLNRLRTKDTVLSCAAVCAGLSFLQLLGGLEYPAFMPDRFLLLRLILSACLILGLVRESIKLIKRTEDLTWNSSLTV